MNTTKSQDSVEDKLGTFQELSKRFSLIRLSGKSPVEKKWTDYCEKKRPFSEIGFLPSDNAGVACGPASRVIVLDVDDLEKFKEVCEQKSWIIPPTFTVRTGSGKPHFYFQYPDNGKKYGNKASKKLGFDLRGFGGQVVAPGSIHPDTGQPYTIAKNLDIAPAPQWLLDLYEEPAKAVVSKSEAAEMNWDGDLKTLPVSARIRELIQDGKPKGDRSEAIMSVLNALVGNGVSEDQICQIFEQYPIGHKAKEKNDQLKWLRDQIEKARKYVAASPISGSMAERPEINAERRDVENVSRLVWDALSASNDPLWLFRNPVGIVCLEKNEDDQLSIKALFKDRMSHILARKISWYKTGKEKRLAALPPTWVIKDMLSDPEPPMPYLLRIVKHPVFSRDGSLTIERGYSEKTKCYYSAPADLVIPKMPEAVNGPDIQKARNTIEDLLHDFPLIDQSEKAHCMGLFILPFVRELIDGQTPLHLIESPSPGTGKSLLARVLTYPALGHHIEFGTVPQTEEEFRKRITSILVDNPSFVLFDNAVRLTSSTLSAVLTAPVWKDRILGKTEDIHLPVKCIWIATGNNPILSTEIARRTVRIRIDSKMDRPWQRDSSSFRHPDIIDWVKKNRGELIWSALVLAKAWIKAGCPKPTQIKPLASFEEYSRVIGGILEFAGVQGFLANADDFYETSDLEGINLRLFVRKWWEEFGPKPVGVSEIYRLITDSDIPIDLGNGKSERSQKTTLGKFLPSLRDRKIGEYQVVRAGNKNGAHLWKLVSHDITNSLTEHHEHIDDVQVDVHYSNLLEEHDKMNINEHPEHFGGGEKNNDDVISDISQQTCDIPQQTNNILSENVHYVQDVHFYVKEQPLIVHEHHNEHLDVQAQCSVDDVCDTIEQSDIMPSQSSHDRCDSAMVKILDNSKSKFTPLICRSGCKHYFADTDPKDGSLKEYCWRGPRSYRIKEPSQCEYFEDDKPVYEYEKYGILRI